MMQHSCKVVQGEGKRLFECDAFRVPVTCCILRNTDSNLGCCLTSHKHCKTLKSPYLA